MAKSGNPTVAGPRDESLRALIRAITAADHRGVQRTTAEALGIPATTLNGFMNRANGASLQITDALKTYLRRSEDEIVAANGDLASLRRPHSGGRSVEVRFGQLPLWSSLLEGARALDPAVPEWAWRDAGDVIVWMRGPITSAMVVDLARFLLRHTPPHA